MDEDADFVLEPMYMMTATAQEEEDFPKQLFWILAADHAMLLISLFSLIFCGAVPNLFYLRSAKDDSGKKQQTNA